MHICHIQTYFILYILNKLPSDGWIISQYNLYFNLFFLINSCYSWKNLLKNSWSNISMLYWWQILGTDDLYAYLSKYRIELDPNLAALVGRFVPLIFFFSFEILVDPQSTFEMSILHRHTRKPWNKFLNGDNNHLAVPEVLLPVKCGWKQIWSLF